MKELSSCSWGKFRPEDGVQWGCRLAKLVYCLVYTRPNLYLRLDPNTVKASHLVLHFVSRPLQTAPLLNIDRRRRRFQIHQLRRGLGVRIRKPGENEVEQDEQYEWEHSIGEGIVFYLRELAPALLNNFFVTDACPVVEFVGFDLINLDDTPYNRRLGVVGHIRREWELVVRRVFANKSQETQVAALDAVKFLTIKEYQSSVRTIGHPDCL